MPEYITMWYLTLNIFMANTPWFLPEDWHYVTYEKTTYTKEECFQKAKDTIYWRLQDDLDVRKIEFFCEERRIPVANRSFEYIK
jgi:hypothetical protein